jgi:metal-responsive CopG/Arc/MetJ family transcriptional regulator
MINIAVKVSPSFLMKIDSIAVSKGLNRSELVDYALQEMLEKEVIPSVDTSHGVSAMMTLRMEEELLKKITAIAKENGISRSELIRRAIVMYMGEKKVKNQKVVALRI